MKFRPASDAVGTCSMASMQVCHRDLMCLAKGLSGGVVPIGATMGTERAFRIFEDNAFIHSTTFGGNPLACAAGIEAIRVILDERLCEHATQMGAHGEPFA